ncbi:DUF4411 family protein [Aneurinibacillus sp. Ricciae_BoGa-3]|uniref:DUF4411 family protein n=1 Tax=Aneurinibacillus sp. Ricciae_BoGa-3 TaxID=3022697 RepID=UPI00234265A6|nr:DUF4411 family protein [Aneurinibacillus sp. Ricciae_BoGa-3]WCK55310.1 DUF4411 family protein [Aneurinibacillus sp. Ricciae_BoGa-3]
MSRYLLDANIFIEAYKRYYAYDIVPSFWEMLKKNAEVGKVISLDRIQREQNAFADTLTTWVNSEFSSYFVSTDNSEVFASYSQIMNWAMIQQQYSDAAKAEFASVADSWLIASAQTYDCVLVTHELYDVNIKKNLSMKSLICPNGLICLLSSTSFSKQFSGDNPVCHSTRISLRRNRYSFRDHKCIKAEEHLRTKSCSGGIK